MKSDYFEVYKFVAGIRRNYILKRIADGLVCGGGLFFAISALLNLLFFLYPVTIIPLAWDLLTVLYFCFAAGWIVDSIFIHKLHIVETAKRIEQKGSLEHPLVSIALELKNTEPQNYFTQKAYSGAVCQLTKLPHSLYSLKLWKVSFFALAAIAWCTTNFTMNPVVADYWKMPFAFLNKGDAAVTPGTVSLPRNASVKIQLKPSGAAFPSCVIDIASAKTGYRRKHLIRPDSTGTFLYAEDSVRESFTYQFTYGGRTFNPETIQVVNPPMLHGLKVKVFPPKYTGLAEREFPEGQGDCSVYAGTRVKIELQSERLSKASLIVNGDSCKMSIKNNNVSGEFTVYNQTAYTFSLQDTFRQKNDSLPVFYVDMIPDDKPFVHFLKPGTNKIVNVNLIESVWLEAVDDLGLKSLKICYYKSGEENEVPQQWNIPIKGNVKTVQRELEWNLGELSLYPGDTVFYWAQASDYRPLKQYQVSRSDTFWFRLASFEEIHEQVVNRENSAQKTISDVRKTQDELGEMVKNVIKQAGGEDELTWDQKQILDKVNETIKAQTDSLKAAINTLQENIEKFKNEGELGEEIIEKMDQIQEALQDLIDQFGDSLFMADNQMITMENMQKAVEKLDKMLPKLNEQLDNTLQYLEMLKHDRELAALALRAENLAQEQSKISESVNKGENLANQEKLLDRISEFSKELSSEADGDSKMPSSEHLDSLHSKMQSQVSQKQSPGMKEMNSMSSELMQLSHKLRQMMSSEKMEQMQAERKRLLDLIDDVLDIAQWQEEIGAQVKTMDREARARFQQTVNDAVKLTRQKTEDLSVIPPIVKKQISRSFSKISESSEVILESFSTFLGESVQIKRNATNLYSLADLMMRIESALSNAQQQSGGSGGGMSDLRGLSAKQMAINAATSELLRALMSGGSGQQQMQGAGQQGGEGNKQAQAEAQKAQEAIADELEKLAEKFSKDNDGKANNVDELGKEARRLAEMLRNPDKNIVDRQERFLSRMLQAALSLHKQGEGKDERKSSIAANAFKEQNTVQNGKVVKDADTFYMLRRKALQGNFPESYRIAVKAYFDSLEVKFLGTKK